MNYSTRLLVLVVTTAALVACSDSPIGDQNANDSDNNTHQSTSTNTGADSAADDDQASSSPVDPQMPNDGGRSDDDSSNTTTTKGQIIAGEVHITSGSDIRFGARFHALTSDHSKATFPDLVALGMYACESIDEPWLTNDLPVGTTHRELSAGQTIVFSSVQGTYIQLQQNIDDDHIHYIASLDPNEIGPVPSGLKVDIPGDEFPGFSAVNIPDIAIPQTLAGTGTPQPQSNIESSQLNEEPIDVGNVSLDTNQAGVMSGPAHSVSESTAYASDDGSDPTSSDQSNTNGADIVVNGLDADSFVQFNCKRIADNSLATDTDAHDRSTELVGTAAISQVVVYRIQRHNAELYIFHRLTE